LQELNTKHCKVTLYH